MGKEGPKERLEMVSREPTWAKGPKDRLADGSKRANLGKEGPKDRLEMVSREPTWAKKAPRSHLGQRRLEG